MVAHIITSAKVIFKAVNADRFFNQFRNNKDIEGLQFKLKIL
jgi:hypothetical protein